MRTYIKPCAILGLVAAAGVGLWPSCPQQARADEPPAPSSFPDVKENDWAYQYVMDLANKGIVKGYPDGKFLGNRAMTRFEFATIIDRMLQTLADMRQQPAPAAAPQVTADDLNKIQVLVDTFQDQLKTIQTNVTQAQADITTLRQQVLQLQHDVRDTKDQVARAQATANNSYGSGSSRKFQISGYIQARYYSVSSSNTAEFPNGAPAQNGPATGNLAKGGAGSTFQLRRARLKFTGQLTPNSRYAIQFDDGGSNNTVTAREGNLTYTTGDGSAKNPSITAGLFSTPFGFDLASSTGSILSPERHLAFNESTINAGPFANQDYDRGAMITIPTSAIRLTVALINGTGTTNGTANNRFVDQVYRGAWQSGNKQLSIGVSYYNGRETTAVVPAGGPPTPAAVPAFGKRQLWGADAQWTSPSGPFLQAEYVGGKFEQRSYFASPAANKLTTSTAPGNEIDGYYIQGGYVFSPKGTHPLTVAASYDRFDRSKSGVAATFPGGAPGGTFDDEVVGGGLLYNLDSATRLRLWYVQPNKVAHAAGTAEPDKVGLFTSEIQVKF